MKGTIIFLTVMLISLAMYGQTRHALVVGIGEYQDHGWKNIYGDNDIPIIKDMLIKNKFTNIKTLKNQEATFGNITRSIEHLIKTVRTGDMVYIHFSCHGQQITDFDHDEQDGRDECIITYDTPYLNLSNIKYNEDTLRLRKHLTDDILYDYFMRINQKIGSNGKLIVVNDACHSGDGSRGDDEDDEYTRSTPPLDVIYAPPFHYDHTKSKPIKWTYISACSAKGKVYETKQADNLYHGALSWALAHDSELWHMPLNQLEITLKDKIQQDIDRINREDKSGLKKNRRQTPSIESTNKETLQLF